MNYYYTDAANQAQGPVNVQTLATFAAQGVLHGKSWVLAEGHSEWKSLDSVIPMPPPRAAAPRTGAGRPHMHQPAAVNPYAAPVAMAGPAHQRASAASPRPRHPSQIPGLGRGGYLLANIAFGILTHFAVLLIFQFGPVVLWGIIIFGTIGSLWIVALRCINIGWSGWYCLISFLPLANIFFGIGCLVYPPDYVRHRKLDSVSMVFLGLIGLVIALLVGAFFFLGDDTPDRRKRPEKSASELPEVPTSSREASPRRSSNP